MFLLSVSFVVPLCNARISLQLISFTLLCNKINITVSFLQSSILTKFVYLFTPVITLRYDFF